MSAVIGDVGVVVIGRNEGQRLHRCLQSLAGRDMPIVYVDSGSTDGSIELARSLGADVVELDMSIPFSAARARNSGWKKLFGSYPQVKFVQFVDGDCQVVDGWIDKARAHLLATPDCAVVCGRRREQHPQASIFNRLADVEWNTPLGVVQSCGGDSLMRREAVLKVNGFDPSIAAGEEPEMCQRLREKGWTIHRIDADMTLHDSAMLRFGQWWRRQVRSGYGARDVSTRFGDRGLFVKQVRSARRWANLYPLAGVLVMVGLSVVGVVVLDWHFLPPLLLGVYLGIPLLQMLRTSWGIRHRAGSIGTALAYGFFTFVGKFAAVIGHALYDRDRASGRLTRLIDYKRA